MNTQEDIQREQGAVEVQTANLQELARLVLESDEAIADLDDEAFRVLWAQTVELAKGVAQ